MKPAYGFRLRGAVVKTATVVVVLASLWLPLVHHLLEKRRDDLAQARRDVNNISGALAEQVTRLVAGVDQVTRLMQEDFKRDPRNFDLAKWTRGSTAFDGIAKAINLFDERGLLIASTLPIGPGTDKPSIADRKEFKELAAGTSRGLVFARTYAGRVSRGMVMPLFRPLEDAAGRFRGVISVSLDPDYLTRQFSSLDVGRDGSLALFGLDGYVRARTPSVPGMYEFSVADLVSRKVPFAGIVHLTSATYQLDSAFDGRTRIYGYRLVGGLPLFLTVGRSMEEVLAPFRREVVLAVTFGGGASVALLSLFGLMLIESHRRGARERALVAAHTALASAEAGLRGVFESSPDVMYVHRISENGTILVERFNQAAAAMGVDARAVGRPLSEILPASVVADAERSIRQVVASGETMRLQGDSSPDGLDREIVIVPLHGDVPSGPINRVFVSVRDIRHLRMAHEAVARSEARHRLLAETTSDVITRLALPNFSREYVSPACRTLFGYEPEEMLGKVPSDEMHPDDQVDVRTRVHRFVDGLETDPRLTVTYRARHKDGRWIWVETCMSIARTAGGDPEALICSLRDVSERHAQADALRQARDDAEEASLAKTDFLATMSHEIRTPLNGILGFAELLLSRDDLTSGSRLHVERIQNAGSALRTVVDDILDFSKLEAGGVELAIAPFRPGALIDNATSIIRGLALAKGLDLIVTIDTAVPAALLGDHDRLRQVLLNLLNNAIKFTRSGMVTLSLGAAPVCGERVRLLCSVRDTGIGIAAAKRSRLFQRFSQVDGTISREFGGTGLGLAMCRSLVEAMGGEIGVESEEGVGSDFWFKIDLTTVAAMPSSGDVEGLSRDPIRASHVLLVEDQELNQDLARAVIEAAGHRVDVVSDGSAAVTAVSETRYDLVLMDVQMPIMDGIEATRRIRDLGEGVADVPIVAITANVLPAQIERFALAGMDGHLGKPFKRDELLDVIARHSRRGETRYAGANPSPQELPIGRASTAFDAETFDAIASTIGTEQAGRLLRRAIAAVAALVDERPSGPRLAAGAHAALAAAGSLGLLEIAQILRSVEESCAAGRRTESLFAAVGPALARAKRASGARLNRVP